VNGMDRQLRDLLQAAAGEPPHRVTVEAVRRRVIRRRVAEFTAGAVAVATIAVVIPVGLGALGHAHRPPPNGGPVAARVFTSRHYGYTETLPAGWRFPQQATQRWNGKGAPADTDPTVDHFTGPGGLEAWVIAAPTNKNLAAYTTTTIRASHAKHPCPAVPQTNQGITIGGAPARLLSMQCPPGSGFLVEIAVTVHHGTALVFASQNPTGITPTDQPADRAAFRNFLAGIRLQR
jgi:hypothetical protein